jgi:hypothetical protein
VLALLLGAITAACGGTAGVAHLGDETSTTTSATVTATTVPRDAERIFQDALKFSQCMRAHGVTDFPDPSRTGAVPVPVNPNGRFNAAQKACQQYAPPGPSPAQQAQAALQALALAVCMRTHGLPNFPDPTIGPDGAINRNYGAAGVDPYSAAFQAAIKHCNP